MQGGDAIWQIILVGAPEEKICEVWTRFKWLTTGSIDGLLSIL
jgi:hypothetical protein